MRQASQARRSPAEGPGRQRFADFLRTRVWSSPERSRRRPAPRAPGSWSRTPRTDRCSARASRRPGWEDQGMEYVLIAIVLVVVALMAGVGLLVSRGRRTTRLDEDAASGT